MIEPILVVGPGRCGTTITAQLLHEKLGIFMGQRFRDFYEDLDFYELNQMFLEGKIGFRTWLRTMETIWIDRQRLNRLWGFKDPQMSYLISLPLALLWNEPLIIRCRRKLDNAAESFCRIWGWEFDSALSMLGERERALDWGLKGHEVNEIDFTEHIPEDELVERLTTILTENETINKILNGEAA